LTSPRDVQSASRPVRELVIRELSSNELHYLKNPTLADSAVLSIYQRR